MRVGKALIVFGVVIILVSFVGWTDQGFGTELNYGEYTGTFVRTASDFNLTVSTHTNAYFNLYIFEYVEGMDVLLTGLPENHTPLIARQNVTTFNEIVVIPKPSWYAVLVTPVNNESIFVDFTIDKILPQRFTIIAGVLSVLVGVMIVGICRSIHRQSQD